ncbi:hypothetical protein CIPAW_11G031600 [Carya illinoinensis]|uniref:Uncharacterized protein n=1 Tax=Carya illinoinensis TaxID=32201 RepID=A0A8T1NXW4_CARIL|nr:hypothetical protein CIPAW_11G031600 [Carya illinoinensis]
MARNSSLDFSSSFQRHHPTAIIMPSSSPFPLTLHRHHYPHTTPTPCFIIIHQPPHDLHHRQQHSQKPKETAQEEEEQEEEEEAEEKEEEEEEEGFVMNEKTLLLSFNLL